MSRVHTNNRKGLLRAELRHGATLLRQLTRAELSTLVALSAVAGYLFFGQGWQLSGLSCLLGVWLLTAGCSALNQWQEQDLDARMERTRNRPLPAGNLTPQSVLLLATLGIIAGLTALLLAGGKPLLLGLLAVIWYNGIYTPLKRRTHFAALPGAVCGSLPALIGWSAAGGSLLAPEILILAGTLFLWQIPHTWLLLCHYRTDLQNSGLPNLFERIATEKLLRINNCWLVALGLCYLLFPLFGLISNPLLTTLFLCLCAALSLAVFHEAKMDPGQIQPLRLFHYTNLSITLLLGTIIIDNLLP